jgi:hypothetical protein
MVMGIELKLTRSPSTDTETMGVISADEFACASIECPWIPDHYNMAGQPFYSCVPTGKYDLEPFSRPNGQEVYQLVNETLGVYRLQEDIPDNIEGRYLILIHVANWVKNPYKDEYELHGCIAPGLSQAKDEFGGNMVSRSKAALTEIMALLDTKVNNTIEIINGTGT